MQVRWTLPAAKDLYSVYPYSRRDNPEATADAKASSTRPTAGAKETSPQARTDILTLPYIVVYSIRESNIEILHIWHGAGDRR
jgi:plasmid stabilization system protein ParE